MSGNIAKIPIFGGKMSHDYIQAARENRRDGIVQVGKNQWAIDGKRGRFDNRETAVKAAENHFKIKLTASK